MTDQKNAINSSPRFIDLFCGLGAFRIAFEEVGFKCVFSSDLDQEIQKVYKKNFGDEPYGDITKVDPHEIPDFEVLLAGFPCQPFSISGKKLGFEDTRGTLFFNVCEIIAAKKPQVVILENVKHLINHDKKRTIKVIINSLKELGYNVSFELLNAKDFGLPQNRERIFIVGTKTGHFDFKALKKKKTPKLSEFLDEKGVFEYLRPEEYTLLNEGVYKQQEDSGLIFIGYRNKNKFSKGIRPNTEHLNRVHRQPNRIYSVEGTHPTLPSQESSGRFFIYIPKENAVRKLTLDECFRIMGYPDNYQRLGRPGTQYKQIGNSIAVNVVREVAKQVLDQNLIKNGSQTETTRDLQSIINGQLSLSI